MKIHDVKLKEIYFEEVQNDIRAFDIRESYVNYNIGDILVFTEVCPIKKKVPRKCVKKISYFSIGDGFGISKNHCILGLSPTKFKIENGHSWQSLIPEHDQLKIIEFWKSEKKNSVNDLKKHFNYSKGSINNVIDNHIKSKSNGINNRDK